MAVAGTFTQAKTSTNNFSVIPQKIAKVNSLELWAWVRNQGRPTASNDSLDGDVILVAQAILQLPSFDEVVIVTTNLKHISRFESEGICVADWQQTLNNCGKND